MSTTIDSYYDFGSPNAYLAWKVLDAAARESGGTLNMHPVLIGGIFKSVNNQPPWMAFGQCQPKMDYMMLEIRRFVKEYGLSKFRMNKHFPVNTLLAMRTAMVAQTKGVHDAFLPAVFKAMWEDSEDVSQPEVLIDVLNRAGLDGTALVEGASDPANKQALADATAACVARGVFGLPAMFVGDELYFGKDTVWMLQRAYQQG